MDTNYSRTEKIVGVFVASVVLLVLVTVVIIGRGKDWFRSYVSYSTNLDESYGIQTNTPVKLFKTDIGRVHKVRLVGNRVEVQLKILEEYASRITGGTRVTVESPTFIGEEYVSIKPGPMDGNPIPPGGVIPAQPRRSLTGLLADFEVEKTARMLVSAIQDLSLLAAQLKDPEGPLLKTVANVEQTTAQVAAITEGLQKGDGTLGELLASRELMVSLQQSLRRVDAILADVQVAAASAPPVMAQVRENLNGMQTIERKVIDSLDQVGPLLRDIQGSVDTLQQILANLEPASRDAPRLTESAAETLASVQAELEAVQAILDAVQQSFLIKPNLPPEPEARSLDSGIR